MEMVVAIVAGAAIGNLGALGLWFLGLWAKKRVEIALGWRAPYS